MKNSPAYEWWNSQIIGKTNLNDAPQIVLPSEAQKIWSKICPLFLLFVIDEQNPRNYWESIQIIVNMFTTNGKVPNPLSHFPEFIEIVFSLKHILIPQTVDNCIVFIDKFGFNDSAHFFLYQSPVFFLNPLLYFETIIILQKMNHHLWTDFINKHQLIDAFFEMYSTFLSPIHNDPNINQILQHRILICELFFTILQNSSKIHPNISSITIKFLENVIDMISLSAVEIPIQIIRVIFSLFSLVESFLSKEVISSYAYILLESSSKASHFYLLFRYFYSKQYVTSVQVLHIISKQGANSITDFNILMEITDDTIAIQLVIFLLKTALHSHLWHRTCFSLIRRCVSKFSTNRQDLKDLMNLIIRRLFLWISYASAIHRYHVRSLLLCESMIQLYESHLNWVQQVILSSANSIILKPTPIYFKSFFPVNGMGQIDDSLLYEWEIFSKYKVKTFPFDSIKGTLIMTTGKDFSKNSQMNSLNSKSNGITKIVGVSNINTKKMKLEKRKSQPLIPSKKFIGIYNTKSNKAENIQEKKILGVKSSLSNVTIKQFHRPFSRQKMTKD